MNNMTKEEIYRILKIAAGFELDKDNFASGSISKSFKTKYENFPHNDLMQEYIPYYPPIEWPEYDEEVWKEELEFPYEYNFEDVRFIQWPGGRHWYAKLGSIDIVDKYGNQKWNDKYYAIEVAKKWCKCGGNWSKYND